VKPDSTGGADDNICAQRTWTAS